MKNLRHTNDYSNFIAADYLTALNLAMDQFAETGIHRYVIKNQEESFYRVVDTSILQIASFDYIDKYLNYLIKLYNSKKSDNQFKINSKKDVIVVDKNYRYNANNPEVDNFKSFLLQQVESIIKSYDKHSHDETIFETYFIALIKKRVHNYKKYDDRLLDRISIDEAEDRFNKSDGEDATLYNAMYNAMNRNTLRTSKGFLTENEVIVLEYLNLLTDKQMEILALRLEDLSQHEIAKELGINQKTVNERIQAIRTKAIKFKLREKIL